MNNKSSGEKIVQKNEINLFGCLYKGFNYFFLSIVGVKNRHAKNQTYSTSKKCTYTLLQTLDSDK